MEGDISTLDVPPHVVYYTSDTLTKFNYYHIPRYVRLFYLYMAMHLSCLPIPGS